MKIKILKFLTILFISVIIFSCESEDFDDDIETNITNQVMFWSDFNGPPISVTIRGGNGSGTITKVSSNRPDCGSSGNFTRTLSPGTYTYDARDGNLVWNAGKFTIREDTSCTGVLLTN